jgi:hypothetical protein
MASKTRITLTHDTETTGDLKNKFQTTSDRIRGEYNNLIDLLAAMAGGSMNGSLAVTIDDGNDVAASGTLTLASVVATNTCTVNGVTFTAVASGATGNQFNVGGTDTITAVNLASAINGSITAGVTGVVSASSAAAVVTVSAIAAGAGGNSLALAGGTHITASGSTLAGGVTATNATTVSYSK